MTDALRAYEIKHPKQCELIQRRSILWVSKGANRLAKYLQWVFVPTVKDAASEQAEAKNTALGKLLARTVRSKVNFAQDIDALRSKAQEACGKLLADNGLRPTDGYIGFLSQLR